MQEERFRLLAENAQDLIYRYRLIPAPSFEYVSPAATDITGYTPQEHYNDPFLGFKLIHPDDQPKLEAINHGETPLDEPVVLRWIRKDGTIIWIEQRNVAIYNEQSQMVAIEGVARDITQRIEAEQSLRKSNHLLENFFSIPLFAVAYMDTNFSFIRVNQLYASLTGQDPASLPGQNHFDLFPNKAQETHFRQVLEQGEPATLAAHPFTNPRNPMPQTSYWDWTLYPVKNGNGAIEGLILYMVDVTNRVQAEARQSAQIAITHILAEATSPQETIPRLIQTICQKLNWQTAELWQSEAEKPVLYRTHTYSCQETGKDTNPDTETQIPGNTILAPVWQQGTPLWFTNPPNDPALAQMAETMPEGIQTCLVVPVGKGNDCYGVLCFLSHELRPHDTEQVTLLVDIGQQISQFLKRKQVETELSYKRTSLTEEVERKTADLKSINTELTRAVRSRDEFLAMMSHELRTPLHAILTLSESLQEGVYGDMNNRQLRSLHAIEESGRHLLEIINDILDIAKIEAGKVNLNISTIDINYICTASLKLVQETANRKHLTVSYQGHDLITTIQADGRRLKQILVNLLSNAIKFTAEGGHIGLEITGDIEQGLVCLTVSDNGIGISPENTRRLFKPFVQIDSSLSRQYQGTGLGLVMVARLTELHGGSIILDSEVGRGSQFTVALPIYHPETTRMQAIEQPQHPSPPPPRTQIDTASAPEHKIPTSDHLQAKILLVDDSETNISSMADYLASKSYNILIARDGVEAIEMVREHRPDLVLMDIQMPVMDGIEAIRCIRASPDMATIPIIALTSLVMPGDRDICLQAGASAYMSKPINLEALLEEIEQLVS